MFNCRPCNLYIPSSTPHRTMQVALASITIAALVIGILGAISYLPSLAMWVGGGAFIASLIVSALYCCCSQKPTHKILKEYAYPLENIRVTEEDLRAFCDYQSEEGTADIACAKNVNFFYGHCDEIDDIGDGCAWRCIQGCASAFGFNHTFVSLHEAYGEEPHNLKEWAEPGYGKSYFDDMGEKSKLYLYNRTEGTRKTRTDKCLHLNSFQEFVTLLYDHFPVQEAPIMIDDQLYAWNILGIKTTKTGKVILWIADPHKPSKEAGLYYLVLNAYGSKIESSRADEEGEKIQSAARIDPAHGWMILAPLPQG